jgi:hypothetical protein
MSEPKSFASLGPTLLARKGGAKPAMRPQLAPLTGMSGGAQAAQALAQDPDEELEDLGWNDMGHEDDSDHDDHLYGAQVFALTPPPANAEAAAESRVVDAVARAEMAATAGEPNVLKQRREVVASIGGNGREPSRLKAVDKSIDAGRRAAFTLRLDAKRHLKLRLASTVKNRSAQQLVTAALDKYLAEIPEIEALAAQVTRD